MAYRLASELDAVLRWAPGAPVCREFGTESHLYMTCSYQASDGRVRSRQERRRVEAGQAKRREASLRDMRKLVP